MLAGLAGLLLLGAAGDRQRIPYLPVPVDESVLPAPRIAYPRVPRDERLAYDPIAVRPRPAIWRIGDADTTIYLFGTIHVLPPGFAWRNAGVERIVAASDTLILESVGDSDGDGAGVGSLIPRTPKGPVLPPLRWRVSPDHRAKLAAVMDGLPREASDVLSGLPTWMAAVAVGFVRDYARGETPGPGADDWLEARFRARGAKIESIEDGARVMAGVNAIPEKEQRRMLDAALDAGPGTVAESRAPIEAWARGDVGPGSALAAELAQSSGPLSDRLLIERNRAWAVRLRQKLATPGTMLFAGGAGHFVGAGSVIELLERSGVRVTRVQ